MSACPDCLRRSALIGALAPRIEGLLAGRSRPGGLLGLPEDELLAVAGGPDADAVRSRLDQAPAPPGGGAQPLCRHDPEFPDRLLDLSDVPPVIWMRGDPALLELPAVAIVGTRAASAYGIEVAESLGRGLAAAGLTVVSGMALGVDGAAHRGALTAGRGGTVAVLASGPDVVYPRRHARLYDRIVETGLVVSELPPGVRPFRWSFPARNRIMAALAELTVVVEAAEKSGSLITAAFAADLGRGVCAVPGRVTARNAAGSNRLLRDGAAVVRDAADVLDEVFGIGAGAAARESQAHQVVDDLDPGLQQVLAFVERSEPLDELAADAGLGPGDVRRALGTLESTGLIRRSGLSGWERCAA